MREKNKTINFGVPRPSFSMGKLVTDITFSVTEECNLRCKYCYLVHKNNQNKMDIKTAKKAVDYILSSKEFFNEKSVIWNFIGGEPLLAIDLIDEISDYIKMEMYRRNHPWFEDYAFNFATNGILYGTPAVQRYINKNKNHLSIGISVDGNKIKHDRQRIYPDGRGSYDDVIKNVPLWLEQFPSAGTKATFAHGDIQYLKDSIISLWNLGIKKISANVVYEDVWTDEDARIFESQLKSLADYIIENNIFESHEYTLSFFNPSIGLPMSRQMRRNKFCGCGKMLAIDTQGNFFPCIRFTEFSLSKNKTYAIGNINDGIYKDRLKPFQYLSINRVQDNECNGCEVASGCSSCTALNYNESEAGTIFKRVKYNCKMHKANARAVEYFWSKIDYKLKGRNNPRQEQKRYFNKLLKRYLLIYTDDKAEPHCNYSNVKTDKSFLKMDNKMLEKAILFAEENDLTPIFIGQPQSTYPQVDCIVNNKIGNTGKVYILHVDANRLTNLSDKCTTLFSAGYTRINIIMHSIGNITETSLAVYKDELLKLSEHIVKSPTTLTVNVLNGRSSELKNPNGCGAGVNTFTVAPNGKLYICPAFYFQNVQDCIGDLEKGFTTKYLVQLDIENADECKTCKNLNCNRCLFINKNMTNEYLISPSIQCKIAAIEEKIGSMLKHELQKKKAEEVAKVNAI